MCGQVLRGSSHRSIMNTLCAVIVIGILCFPAGRSWGEGQEIGDGLVPEGLRDAQAAARRSPSEGPRDSLAPRLEGGRAPVTYAQNRDRAAMPAPRRNAASNLRDFNVSIEPDSSLKVLVGQTPILTSSYVFWGAEWTWAPFRSSLQYDESGVFPLKGSIQSLGITVSGDVTQEAPNIYTYTLDLDVAKDLSGINGGGLQWDINVPQGSGQAGMRRPTLLDDNRGWEWEIGPGQFIKVTFAEPIPKVFFENNNPRRIRTFLLGQDVDSGRHSFTMTIALPEGTKRVPSLDERYGPTDTSTWYRDALQWNTSPVDLRFLNDSSAGQHGFVRAEGDQLIFEDGTPARFWGGNLVAYALSLPNSEIETQAKRIAQLGFNLMRIHHHDSMVWVHPTVIAQNRDDSRSLDEQFLDRIDYWIKCLKDEGVYVWLDLHVGRVFKAGDVDTEFGRIEGFEEINDGGRKRNGEVKGFVYFSEPIQELMKEFNAQYLNHVNPYTGNAYKDEPAIIALLITNENDLTRHQAGKMLKNSGNPVYNRIFESALKDFSEDTGVDLRRAQQIWKPGPAKLFLNHREHLFNVNMLEHLAQLGVKIPIVTTNTWGHMGVESLPALSDGDMIDVHSYSKGEALSIDPNESTNFVSWISMNHVYGKPLSVTEWNERGLGRFTAPMYLASISSLQGWDALMIYDYGDLPFSRARNRPQRFATYADPALTGAMPAAAIAFRRQDIRPAEKEYCLMLSREQVYFQGLDVASSLTARTLMEQSKFTIGLPDVPELGWDTETKPDPSVIILTDVNRNFLPSGQQFVESDTGEIHRDWSTGVHLIDTQRTQVASGWIGGKIHRLSDVVVDVSTPNAMLAVTSLDGEPISRSNKLLITALARVVPRDDRQGFLSEPVTGTIKIRAPKGMVFYPLSSDGTLMKPIETQVVDGVYEIALSEKSGSHWFLFQKSTSN